MEHQEQACMGGMCSKRTSCARYVCPVSRQEPAERLCKGDADHFMPLHRLAQISEPKRAGVPA